MIPELGHLALILAFLLAIVQGTLPLAGAARRVPAWMALARPVARGQFMFIAAAWACLAWSFITSDFSVLNVATNSNSQLPLHYRFAATWGSHEGSMMLWVLMLSFPFPYIATTAGWMTAELGRQPWLVYGLMRTSQGNSARVSAGSVAFSTLGFMGLYVVLGLVFVFLIGRAIARGPEAKEAEAH